MCQNEKMGKYLEIFVIVSSTQHVSVQKELVDNYLLFEPALAGACLPHGGWPHPKRHSLWTLGMGKGIQRPPTAALQGCLQERHEST